MLRNLKKVKSLPYFPTLLDLYIAGPGESILMSIASKRKIGELRIMAINDAMISNNLLSTIDRQSSLECLYSSAMILSIFSGA